MFDPIIVNNRWSLKIARTSNYKNGDLFKYKTKNQMTPEH